MWPPALISFECRDRAQMYFSLSRSPRNQNAFNAIQEVPKILTVDFRRSPVAAAGRWHRELVCQRHGEGVLPALEIN